MKKNFIRIGNNLYACKCLRQKLINGFYVPCGKCEFCRKAKARDWAFRVEADSKYKYTYNVLLTYDDEHLYCKQGIPSLNKLHITEFMKRLRYYVDEIFGGRLRYFLAGEYGGLLKRPHYHLILISDNSLEVDDSTNGSFNFIHELIETSWKKGFCNIEHLHCGSASVRYLVQYLDGFNSEHSQVVAAPFRMMTRGNRYTRGLGYNWIEDNKELVAKMQKNIDYTIRVELKDGKKVNVSIPRYYKRIICPEEHLIKMADDYYNHCQEYITFINSLTNEDKRKFVINHENNLREQFERERTEYINKKVSKRKRSAGKLFTTPGREVCT